MYQAAKRIVSDASFYPSFHRLIEEAKRDDEFKPIKTIYIKAIATVESNCTYGGTVNCCDNPDSSLRILERDLGAYPGALDSIFKFKRDNITYMAHHVFQREDVKEALKLAGADGKSPAYAALVCSSFGAFMLNGLHTFASNYDRPRKWEYMLKLVSDPVLQVVEFSNQFFYCLNAVEQNFEEAALLWRKGARKREPHDYGYQARVTLNRMRSWGHNDR